MDYSYMKPREDFVLNNQDYKILNKLKSDSLTLIKLANDDIEKVPITQNILRYLIINGFVDTELNEFNRTVFTLTKKGSLEIERKFRESKDKCGKWYGASFYINGVYFNSKKELINYIMSIINNYKEGEYLSLKHQKMITDCLRYTDWGLALIPDIFKIKVCCNTRADVLSIAKNDNSTQELRVHGLFSNTHDYHKEDVRNALRYALHTEERTDGLQYYNAGLSFSELMTKFLEDNNLNLNEIVIIRRDKHLVLAEPDLNSKWVDFYHANSTILLLTPGEIGEIDRKKHTSKQIVYVKCQDCENEFIAKHDAEKTVITSCSICHECQVKRNKENKLRKELQRSIQRESELNMKIKQAGIHKSYSTHLTDLAMEDSKLKKHLVDGDIYNEV